MKPAIAHGNPLPAAAVGLLALALGFLFLGAVRADAATVAPGTPASFCSGTGALGGECGELKGVAADQSTGSVYVVDSTHSRVSQFAADGSFVRAFGADVVASGPHNDLDEDGAGPDLANQAEVCEAGVDVCKGGSTSGTIGGALGTTIAPRGIAVDPQTHIVYVAAAVARLALFDGSTGAFLGQTEGDGSNVGNTVPPPVNFGAPERFGQVTGIALDTFSPGGPYLYVSVTGGVSPNFRSKINKFTAAGPGGSPAPSYVCQITGTAVASSVNGSECGGNGLASHRNGAFEGIVQGGTTMSTNQVGGNLAVDAAGNVFIAESPGTLVAVPPGRHVVSGFDKDGNFLTQFRPSGGSPALSAETPRPEALGISPMGKLLVAAGGASNPAGGTRIQEYDAPAIAPAVPPAIATATPELEFGFGTLGGSVGIAFGGADVYVTDKANKKTWKYTFSPEAPLAVTEAATAITKSKATLHGKVTANLSTVTDCHFEYGLDTSYGQTAPCQPAHPDGGTPVAVTAQLTGLQLSTTYHMRLVVTNSVGTDNGDDVTFTTSAVNNPEAITLPGATQITQATAKVAGEVNPNEVAVTDCHFNYGTSTSYGQTAPCAPASPGAGDTLVDVTGDLSGLSPNTTYHFQLDATNGDGNDKGADQSFKTLPLAPTLSDFSAEQLTQVSAKVNAKVNPNEGAVSSCVVEYGPTTAYGSQKPCSPSPGDGSAPVSVSAAIQGLTASTTYHYRVVATNPGGTTPGPDRTFLTLSPNLPGASTNGSTGGAGDTFVLEGQVDPNGLAVSECYFAYGKTAAYEKTAPCAPTAASLGTGDVPVAVTTVTEALEPETTYHFRLFAVNARGESKGKDRILTTGARPGDACANAAIRAAQGIEVVRLPRCMALEQVSPVKKGNQHARNPLAVSADGQRVLYNSVATLGDCPNLNALGGDSYLANRDGSGWVSSCTNMPFPIGAALLFPAAFSPDLSEWLVPGRPGSDAVLYRRTGDTATQVSPGLRNLTGPGFMSVVGISRDYSHSVITTQGSRLGSLLPGSPTPEGAGFDRNLYVALPDSVGQPTLELLARDRDGKIWGGNCGVRLGGVETELDNLRNGHRQQGAVAVDGSRVYFSTRASQPETGPCTTASKMRIMTWGKTPTGPKVDEPISPECTRVSPACSGVDGDDAYQGASVDQRLVYFTTTRQLDDADLDSNADSCSYDVAVPGCDLYLYDADRPVGDRLIDVSAGDSSAATPGEGASVRNSITAISADGSHVYFVARTVLTADPNPAGDTAQDNANNLYLHTYPEEELSFVGTLSAGDGSTLVSGLTKWGNGAYAVPIVGTDSAGKSVGGDGHVLLFNTEAQLLPGDSDAARDLYRYDSEAGALEWISKAAPGGADNEGSDAIVSPFLGGWVGNDYPVRGRWASEDGESVVFTTEEPLLPGDTNGAEDSYLWRGGQLYRLPGSTRASLGVDGTYPVLSYDGSTIAYHTTKPLLPSDGDTVLDVYVLRSGGGLPVQETSTCEGEACQGAPGLAPGDIGAVTGAGASAGNVRSVASRCPKGKRKVNRKGRARCVKPARKHRKQAKKKRTSHQQGGRK